MSMRHKSLRQEHERLSSRHEETKYRFIVTELELAITFCELAFSSNDPARSSRNSKNARQAYESAVYFLQDTDFSDQMRAAVEEKVAKLKTLLRQLDLHKPSLLSPKPAAAH